MLYDFTVFVLLGRGCALTMRGPPDGPGRCVLSGRMRAMGVASAPRLVESAFSLGCSRAGGLVNVPSVVLEATTTGFRSTSRNLGLQCAASTSSLR